MNFFVPGQLVMIARGPNRITIPGIMMRLEPSTFCESLGYFIKEETAIVTAVTTEIQGMGPWLLLTTSRGLLGWSASTGTLEIVR